MISLAFFFFFHCYLFFQLNLVRLNHEYPSSILSAAESVYSSSSHKVSLNKLPSSSIFSARPMAISMYNISTSGNSPEQKKSNLAFSSISVRDPVVAGYL